MRPQRIDVDGFTRRLLQDCFAEAARNWWLKRAEDFERARPTVDEYHGAATPQELAERDRRLAGIARACRHRAYLALAERDAPEVDQVLEEVG